MHINLSDRMDLSNATQMRIAEKFFDNEIWYSLIFWLLLIEQNIFNFSFLNLKDKKHRGARLSPVVWWWTLRHSDWRWAVAVTVFAFKLSVRDCVCVWSVCLCLGLSLVSCLFRILYIGPMETMNFACDMNRLGMRVHTLKTISKKNEGMKSYVEAAESFDRAAERKLQIEALKRNAISQRKAVAFFDLQLFKDRIFTSHREVLVRQHHSSFCFSTFLNFFKKKVQWMTEVCLAASLSPVTLHLSVALLDGRFARSPPPKLRYQLAAASSLLVAGHFFGVFSIHFNFSPFSKISWKYEYEHIGCSFSFLFYRWLLQRARHSQWWVQSPPNPQLLNQHHHCLSLSVIVCGRVYLSMWGVFWRGESCNGNCSVLCAKENRAASGVFCLHDITW